VAALVRYMTHANRLDFLEVHWLLVAEEKMWGLAELLLDRQRQNSKLIEKYRADVARVRVTAAAMKPEDQELETFLTGAKDAFLKRSKQPKKRVGNLTTAEKEVC
jgi:hypothetical protein